MTECFSELPYDFYDHRPLVVKFYSDNDTPRIASNSNIVAVPFNPSADLGILLLLCGFGLRQLKHKFNDKS